LNRLPLVRGRAPVRRRLDGGGLGGPLRRAWRELAERVSWTPPTRTEVVVVAKAALAAALSWWLAVLVSDVRSPVLAPLTALICVRVSVRGSVRSAIQRSAAVVLGVIGALAVGDALGLNTFTVGLLTFVSLGVAVLVLRLPRGAASQVPVTVLVVMSSLAENRGAFGWERVVDTVLGAAVGVVVSLALPSSRLADARQTLARLAETLREVLDTMGAGLHAPFDTEQTGAWRRTARVARDRLVPETRDAVGNGREAARWNIRDRRHIVELGRYEDVLPRLERTAIGVSVIARGIDDLSHHAGGVHAPMPDAGALLTALADLVRVTAAEVLDGQTDLRGDEALAELRRRREPCARAAAEHARTVPGDDGDGAAVDHRSLEWMSAAALLVQVDRLVDDLSAPLPP